MITIYGIQSPYVARVRAVLLQKGLQFQHVSVNLGQKSEAFKKLTPIETIPVIEDDDGTVICDSLHAILYLDEKYPVYKMLGNDWKTKLKILTVVEAVDKAYFYLSPLYIEKNDLRERLIQSGRSHRARVYSEQEKQDMRKEVQYRLQRLEALRGKKFFTSQFSAADAAMLSLLRQMHYFAEEIPAFWKKLYDDLLKDAKIAAMFPAQDEKGVREI